MASKQLFTGFFYPFVALSAAATSLSSGGRFRPAELPEIRCPSQYARVSGTRPFFMRSTFGINPRGRRRQASLAFQTPQVSAAYGEAI